MCYKPIVAWVTRSVIRNAHMKISYRIFLGYFLIVGLAAYFILQVFVNQVKPGVRQSMESSLVDTANVLAQLAANDVRNGVITDGEFASAIKSARTSRYKAGISDYMKEVFNYRIIITDDKGRVIYDSENIDIGKDYSRWNDIYLTLRGQYGARSTRSDPNDERSTVMYVAAPVMDGDKLIGVLSVANPNASIQPFIDKSQANIVKQGWILIAASFLIGLAVTFWFTRSLDRLGKYAKAVALGERAVLPDLGNNEMGELGTALDTMRKKLDGKQYVEQYVQTLTHEMKSPLAAIRGASEILEENPPELDRLRFLENIKTQSVRLSEMIDKMLALASVEYRQNEIEKKPVNLAELCRKLVASLEQGSHKKLQDKKIQIEPDGLDLEAWVQADAFLITQALQNLLDNAIDFSPDGGLIKIAIEIEQNHYCMKVQDQGSGIPDYAITRLFERFYSLPRPDTGQRSSGLGLSFVKEVALAHKGEVSLVNLPGGGVMASLTLARN
jgi:two-component system, OmpR family, sensor histidine kinase CreC